MVNGKIVENRKSKFLYELVESFEAGIELKGFEIKSLREGNVNINASFVYFKADEMFVHNLVIEPYSPAGFLHLQNNVEKNRVRKLLLHKSEIKKISNGISKKGLVGFVIKLYFNKRGKVKLLIAIGKPKNKADKRNAIKERDWKKSQSAILKDKNR
ncbi:MAG: SsrA-binding protein SmpB [Alphaproteobacteria bacterium]|nr:SsrA-binding protein SmpB [Alphaproteobacteria bacterium]MBL0718249.1 SsrA-binding protein SmpB [Alphaproteobacteria bacterium]